MAYRNLLEAALGAVGGPGVALCQGERKGARFGRDPQATDLRGQRFWAEPRGGARRRRAPEGGHKPQEHREGARSGQIASGLCSWDLPLHEIRNDNQPRERPTAPPQFIVAGCRRFDRPATPGNTMSIYTYARNLTGYRYGGRLIARCHGGAVALSEQAPPSAQITKR